jgi:subtilisin family serine protease
MTATVWRGTTYPVAAPSATFGQVSSDGTPPAVNTDSTTFGIRVSSIEAEIQSCIDAGIIFVASAGNQALKCDVPSGQDYNNYWINSSGTQYYYHRGTTPGAASNVVCVGATSHTLPEHKIQFSNTGPRVDVFAPGNGIMGGYINSPYIYNSVADPRSSASTSTVTTFYLNMVSGTSQACPQVAGVIACLLQSRVWYSQWQVQQWLSENAVKNTLTETYYGGSGYGQYAGLQGATNQQLFQPFNNPQPFSITSNSN